MLSLSTVLLLAMSLSQASCFATTRPAFGTTTTRLYAGDDDIKTSHSYVEGASFDSRMEEIEAMGGDPFFAMDPADNIVEQSTPVEVETPTIPFSPSALGSILERAAATAVVDDDNVPRYVMDGKGPMPSKHTERVDPKDFLWDGTVDEDAHMGLD
jgi:hypothetical protein